MVFVAFLMQEFQEKHVSYWKHLLHEFSAGSREEGKEGDQVFTSQEEPQADDPIELLNRMSGKSEQFRSTGNKNISPITPSFEHDGYEHAKLSLFLLLSSRKGVEMCFYAALSLDMVGVVKCPWNIYILSP
jgi:hypothetical protein